MITKMSDFEEAPVTTRNHTLPPSFILAAMWRFKRAAWLSAGLAVLLGPAVAIGQGTFQNLDFESALNPNGSLPGWSASFSNDNGTSFLTQIMYDGISLGSAFITINDTHGQEGVGGPLQGNYSLLLAGGNNFMSGGLTSSTISQTGLIPSGTMSILIDVEAEHAFTVSMGSQAINMVPLQTFSTYTLYGGDISAFAGQSAELSITSPFVLPPEDNPNMVLLDDITFSTQVVPEPSIFALSALGALLLSWRVLGRFKVLPGRKQSPS